MLMRPREKSRFDPLARHAWPRRATLRNLGGMFFIETLQL